MDGSENAATRGLLPDTAAERLLKDLIQRHTASDGGTIVVRGADFDQHGRTIRGEYVRQEIIDWRGRNSASTLELQDLRVKGVIDLAGIRIDLRLHLTRCKASFLNLNDAQLTGIRLTQSVVRRVHGIRLVLAGNFSTHDPVTSRYSLAQTRSAIGQLDLGGAEIGGNLDLRNTDLRGWRDESTGLPIALRADGVHVKGNLLIGQGTTAKGEVKINGCTVGRNLDASGCSISNKRGYAFSIAGSDIKGNLRFHRPATRSASEAKLETAGTLRISGVTIGGSLDLTAATCVAPSRRNPSVYIDTAFFSIEAQGSSIGENVRLNGLRAVGSVDMTNISVDGDLDAEGASFSLPGLNTLIIEGGHIKGSGRFEDVTTNGVLRFVHTTFESRLMIRKLKIVAPSVKCIDTYRRKRGTNQRSIEMNLPKSLFVPTRMGDFACGLNLNRATVNGVFELGVDSVNNSFEPGFRLRRWISLAGLTASEFNDQDSWNSCADQPSKADRLCLEGFRYGRLTFPGQVDFHKPNSNRSADLFTRRLNALDSEYAPLNALRFRSRYGLRKWLIQKDQLPPPLSDRLDTKHGTPSNGLENWRSFIVRLSPIIGKSPSPSSAIMFQPVVKELARAAFNPQPYLQLIERFRTDGFHREAEHIAVRLEVNRKYYAGLHPFDLVLSWLNGIMLKYGYGKGRLVAIVLTWILLSSVIFDRGYNRHQITASQFNGPSVCIDPPQQGTVDHLCKFWKGHVRFNPVLFSLDSIIPIVNIGQRSNWVIVKTDPEPWQKNPLLAVWQSLIFNLVSFASIGSTLLGWLLPTLFLAGLTGLRKRSG